VGRFIVEREISGIKFYLQGLNISKIFKIYREIDELLTSLLEFCKSIDLSKLVYEIK